MAFPGEQECAGCAASSKDPESIEELLESVSLVSGHVRGVKRSMSVKAACVESCSSQGTEMSLRPK